ncbi:winged helix-turn-helix transcriptional regulator [Cochlodiniinecator piscidefendens]|uniref:winged helix-turn-helix transcriptional regulator n=1 Tax=Cochlodiniinecator piscidefendens TaxID=2715756 RepID=UPI00140B0280|nr:helix-turn-helix domain-containing protein [Cochlodiniinecator piscidefendens]
MTKNASPAEDSTGCPVEFAIEIIGGKWKCHILSYLATGTKRFGALRRHIPEISQRVLTQKLRQLEENGVVHRDVFASVPPHTEYSLTPLGQSLLPVLDALETWANKYQSSLELKKVN